MDCQGGEPLSSHNLPIGDHGPLLAKIAVVCFTVREGDSPTIPRVVNCALGINLAEVAPREEPRGVPVAEGDP